MTEQEYNYLFGRMTTLGPVNYDRLLSLYGSPEKAWMADNPMLTSKKQMAEWGRMHDPEEEKHLLQQKVRMEEQGISYLDRKSPLYPEAFRRLADPPIGIFIQGKLPGPMEDTVAIIGARQCTPYGKAVAMHLAGEMAKRKIWVISGMALGTDAWGQRSALDHGGPSLALLGSGIDVCYPQENHDLFERLKQEGGLMSEYGPGQPGLAFHFPLRNRLISALSKVIVVVEARRRSGTMITVDQALEQGKNVLAVPGRLDDPMSVGCHDLLRQGAGLCTHVDDILRELGWSDGHISNYDLSKQEEIELGLSDRERRIYDLLMLDPVHVDDLIAATRMSMGELMTSLWRLEQKKLCRQVGSNTYQKT